MTPLHIPDEVATLGDAVQWAREKRGFSIDRVALRAKCSPATIYWIERKGMGTRRHAELAAALGVPVEEIERRPRGPSSKAPQAKPRILTAEAAKARPTVEPRRCGLCRKTEHLTIDCPLRSRVARKFCAECCGLSHRRPMHGRCLCGGTYAPEVVERSEATAQSSGQLCVDAA